MNDAKTSNDCSIILIDIDSFTDTTQFILQGIVRLPFFAIKRAEQAAQLDQVIQSKQGAASRHHDKRIGRSDVRPTRRDPHCNAVGAENIDTRLTPRVSIDQEIELLPVKRMKRMRNPNALLHTLAIGCN
jgi:hypothetical protein